LHRPEFGRSAGVRSARESRAPVPFERLLPPRHALSAHAERARSPPV
jgi:hypothetical protein